MAILIGVFRREGKGVRGLGTVMMGVMGVIGGHDDVGDD